MADNEASLLLRIKQVGGEILDNVTDKLKEMGKAVLVVGSAIAAFGTYAIKQFKESEAATNSLNQSLVQQGIYTKALAGDYKRMAEALAEKSLFQDEEITQAQAIIQNQIGQKKISQELMQATLNLAAAKKMDLASAAELVGKTLGTETNALARQGIELDNVRDKNARTAEVIQKLNGHFGGQAEAATKGLGALEMMSKAANEFMESVGERLAPVVSGIAQAILNFTTNIKNSEDAMNGIMSVMQAVAQIGIVVKGVFEVVGQLIGNVLGGIAKALDDVVHGRLMDALDSARNLGEITANDISATWKKGKEEMAQIDKWFSEGQEANRQNDEALLAASEARKLEIKKEAAALDKEFFETKNTEEIEAAALKEQIKGDAAAMARLNELNNIIKTSNSKMAVLQAETQKERLIKDQKAKLDIAREEGVYAVQAFLNSERVKNTGQILGQISTLQNSSSKELVAVGKAAAIAQAIINTAQGVTLALATFPGPFGIALGALVAAAGAVQIGTIAGVKMAEGGIVRATPGGIPATIGEGGYDEAVIPLDGPNALDRLGGGGGLTVNFNGSFLGDETQAMQVARVLDRAFLRLRQQNESVAFDLDSF